MPTRLMAATLAALAVTTGCAGDQPTTASSSAPVASPINTSTTSQHRPTVAEDREAIRRTAEAWAKAVRDSWTHPDPTDPSIDKYLTDPLKTQFRREFARRQREHLGTRPPENAAGFYRIDTIAIEGDAAALTECVLDDTILFDTRTGEIWNDRVVTQVLNTKLVRTDGGWLLTRRTSTTQEGVVGCAAR